MDLCRPNERKRHCASDCWRYIHRHLYDQHRRHSNCDRSLLALGLCIWRNRGTSLDAASTVWRLRFRPPSRVPAVWAWTFFEVSPAWPRSGHMSLARPFKAGSARTARARREATIEVSLLSLWAPAFLEKACQSKGGDSRLFRLSFYFCALYSLHGCISRSRIKA